MYFLLTSKLFILQMKFIHKLNIVIKLKTIMKLVVYVTQNYNNQKLSSGLFLLQAVTLLTS